LKPFRKPGRWRRVRHSPDSAIIWPFADALDNKEADKVVLLPGANNPR
jgi:hypothetical protein